jgi:gluconate 2-dehydrogenase gamma chain
VVGLQERYLEGLTALGADFAALGAEEQHARLDAVPGFTALLHEHACESTYGDPVYGGNRDGAGWRSIGFTGDVQPRGWTPVEVSGGG